MPERKGAHLDYDDRCTIEDGIRDGFETSVLYVWLFSNTLESLRMLQAAQTVYGESLCSGGIPHEYITLVVSLKS